MFPHPEQAWSEQADCATDAHSFSLAPPKQLHAANAKFMQKGEVPKDICRGRIVLKSQHMDKPSLGACAQWLSQTFQQRSMYVTEMKQVHARMDSCISWVKVIVARDMQVGTKIVTAQAELQITDEATDHWLQADAANYHDPRVSGR